MVTFRAPFLSGAPHSAPLKPKVPNRPTVSVVGSVVPHGPASAVVLAADDPLPPHPASTMALVAATATRDATDPRRRLVDVLRMGVLLSWPGGDWVSVCESALTRPRAQDAVTVVTVSRPERRVAADRSPTWSLGGPAPPAGPGSVPGSPPRSCAAAGWSSRRPARGSAAARWTAAAGARRLPGCRRSRSRPRRLPARDRRRGAHG